MGKEMLISLVGKETALQWIELAKVLMVEPIKLEVNESLINENKIS